MSETTVGSIVGFLRLEAGEFHREMERALAETEALDGKKVDVKVKTNASTAASEVRAMSGSLDSAVASSRRVEDATSRLNVAQARLNELRESGRAKTSQILTAEGALAKARRAEQDAVAATYAGNIALNRAQDDVAQGARRATKEVGGFADSFNGLRDPKVIVAAIGAGMALVGPVTGAATAAMGGFVGVAGTALLAFQGFKNEVAKGTVLGKELKSTFAGIQSEISALGVTASHAMAGDLLDGLGKIRSFLPSLNSGVESLSGHLGRAFSVTAGGVVGALQTMMPLLQDGGRYAEVLAQKFADFAASQDFKNFVDYARRELPNVGQALLSLASGVKDLAVSLAPVGDDLVSIIGLLGKGASAASNFVDMANKMPTTGLFWIHKAGDLYRHFTGDAQDATKAVGEHTSYLLTLQQVQSSTATAMHTTDAALNKVRDSQRASAQAARDATLQMQMENDAAGLLKQSLDNLNGTNLSAAQAQNTFDSSLANMGDHVTAQGKKITFTTTSIKNMSAASVALRGQLLGQVTAAEATAEAYGQVRKSSEAGREKLVALRKEIIDNAVAHGVDRKAVTNYIDTVLKVPKKVPPTKLQVDTAAALTGIAAFQAAINALHGKTVVTHYAYTGTLPNGGRSTAGGSTFADGGPISGPGTGTSDSIPAWLSNGEYVVNAAATSKHKGLLDSINAGKFANGGPVGMASGGSVPLSQWFSSYMSGLGSTVTKNDLAKDRNAIADATVRLHIAEMKLHEDRKHHKSALTIARDEAAITRAREGLASATSRLSSASAHYAAQQGSMLGKFAASTAIGVRDAARFVSNIEKLASRGYVQLAQQLAAMGGPEAEAIAAQAAGASSKSLNQISANVAKGAVAQNQLGHIDAITAILGMKSNQGARALASSSGIDVMELLDAAALIKGMLKGNKNASNLLGDLAKRSSGHLFASGGLVRGAGSATSDSISARLSNGEFVVNAAATARNRGLLDAINGGGTVELGDATVARIAVAMSHIQVRPVVTSGQFDSAMAVNL